MEGEEGRVGAERDTDKIFRGEFFTNSLNDLTWHRLSTLKYRTYRGYMTELFKTRATDVSPNVDRAQPPKTLPGSHWCCTVCSERMPFVRYRWVTSAKCVFVPGDLDL